LREVLVVKDLYTICIFADVREERLFDLVAFAASDAEEEVIEGCAA
jgi:hypothetical protein